MAKRAVTKKAVKQRTPFLAELSSPDGELSALRAEYARKPAKKRRAAAQWTYDESISTQLFGAAIAHLKGGNPFVPEWPAGFVALAVDPEYAPALLTVGCHEYSSGYEVDGMSLLLQLTGLPPETPDWVEIIDEAGTFLVERNEAAGACRLYEAALRVQPEDQTLIVAMGWALCRSHQHAAALPWLTKAIANSPEESSVHNDFGWALVELGRLDEAERELEKAVRLASANDSLAANNLKKLRRLRSQQSRAEKRKSNHQK
jgi:tetratricopeptide (TPR) repeat protein